MVIYIVGLVLPVRKDKLDAYQERVTVASQVWMQHRFTSLVVA